MRCINKINLINNLTPIVKLKKEIGNTSIYMKRDDLIDFYFGGNKVRLYEYIISDVIKQKAEKLITFGSIHSNHVRVTAAVAAYFSLDCDIIIIQDHNNASHLVEGNSLLIDFIGVNKYVCSSENAREYIDNHLNTQDTKGVNYYFVPGGGHTPIATMAYSDIMNEILSQSEALNVNFDAIFLPTGTGTTQAGLLHGKDKFKFDGEIFGVTVARESKRCKKEIIDMINGLRKIDSQNVLVEESSINILENSGIGYGEIDERIIKIMKDIAKSDGILLDPIYNAKSFYAMTKYLTENKTYTNVLYLNTGGVPNIFIEEISRKAGSR
ncbi:pyridoxal-phosphate dependent enzyme [Clostridium sp. D2Q-14]|uniref:1-aminocyclopropane-1-carboxylate deaminase/D-cysteine desulfhydrase n=1 Tax=Anaeromonas gelatinilytica TaxID=2683194 RepID=UPI00193BFAD5|nr:pyridoxal-phosphate dependent enzyme [Anaeromonas gelatinilytica]